MEMEIIIHNRNNDYRYVNRHRLKHVFSEPNAAQHVNIRCYTGIFFVYFIFMYTSNIKVMKIKVEKPKECENNGFVESFLFAKILENYLDIYIQPCPSKVHRLLNLG